MNKKSLVFFFTLLASFFTLPVFAVNDISLLDKSKNNGMTIYWDSLSESGMIEKNGHQLSFRNGESIVLLDSVRMMITDAPELRDNQLYVSKKFLDDSEEFFNQKSEMPFKVGAILIDAGHGGKDPGALKTYKINGKNVTIQEKDITLKVSKDGSIIDTCSLAPGNSQSADLFIPLSNQALDVKIIFQPKHYTKEYAIKKIELWYY